MRTLPRITLCWALLAPVALAGDEPQAAPKPSNQVLSLAPADPLFMLWTTDLPAVLENRVAAIIAGELGGADLAGLARAWRETFGGPAMISVRAKALRPDALGISFAAEVPGDTDDLFERLGNFAGPAMVGPAGAPMIEVGRDGDLITVRPTGLPLALTLYLGVRNGVAFGDTWRQTVVDYLHRNEPDAEGEHFIDTDAFKKLPAANDLRTGRADLLAYLDLKPLIALARTQVDEGQSWLFDAFGLDAFQSAALTADWSGKTLSATLAVAVTDEQSGLAKLLVPVNGKIQAASILPADCPLAWCGAMTSASDFVDRLCEIAEAVDADIVDEYRTELAEVTREFGFDPQHDFLANLVDEWAVGIQVGQDDKPHAILAVKLADADLFHRHLQNLVTGYRLPIDTTVYRGVQIVSRGDGQDPPIALAVLEDYLVIACSSQWIAAAIDARAEHKTLDTRPGVKSITGRLPSPTSRFAVANLGRFAELALAEMDEHDDPHDPAAQVFRQVVGTDATIGLAVTSRPGMITVDLALNESGTAALVDVVAPSLTASILESREQARRVLSMTNMTSIMICCLIYADEHKGEFPPSLSELVADGGIIPSMRRGPHDDGSGPPDDAAVIEQMSFYLYRPGLNTQTMTDPASMVVLAEPEVRNGRGAAVAFADGHVEWVTEPEAGRIIAELQPAAR